MVEWVNMQDRPPRREDADEYGCVMIWDELNGVMITGWRNEQMLYREPVTHWARTPEGPPESLARRTIKREGKPWTR